MIKRICFVAIAVVIAASTWAQTARTVRDVRVEGNSTVNAMAITGTMRLQPGQVIRPEDIARDETEIANLGFFRRVEILTRDVPDTSSSDLVVLVSEFPIVKEVNIEGNSVFSAEQLTEEVVKHQTIGQIWNNRNALPIANGIRQLYTAKGFFIDFEQIGPLDGSEGTLNIRILETRVGEIRLTGLNRTRERTVRRIMRTEPGEPLNFDRIQRDLEELYFTYWFEEIRPNRTLGETPNIINLDLEFKEARTATINAGVALDPQSRLVGTASYGDTNFRGLGQTVGVQLEQATVGGGPSVTLAYGNRFYDARDTQFNARLFSRVVYNFTGNGVFGDGGGVGATDADRFDERRTGFNVSFLRPIGEIYRASVGLTAQNVRTINLATTTTEDFVQQDGDLVTLLLSGEYNTSVPSVEPVRGQSLRLTLEPGYSNITKIGGNVSRFADTLGSSLFLRSTLQYRQYWSNEPERGEGQPEIRLSDPRPVLAFKADFGHISGTVPFFEQLFIGGTNSLRGYANQRFWGSNSLLATLEYRYPIQRSFNIVGFVDYGGAWGGYGNFRGFEQSDSPRLRLGYGAGLAFRTPLGPIRIDFAFNQEGGSRTHFSVGTSF